jgi:hypothetical protein
MKKLQFHTKHLKWFSALLLTTLIAACGGSGQGRDPILGANGIAGLAPTVTAVTPLNASFGVVTANPVISATLNEEIAPLTSNVKFTVTCASPCVSPAGTLTLDSTKKTITLATVALTPATLYTATISGASSLTTGLALASPYTWQFTTVATVPDTTRPRVTATFPLTTIPGPTAGAATNAAITANFSKSMLSATVTANYTLSGPGGTAVSGTASYSAASKTVVFRPTVALATGTTYTAKISSSATDVSGNALAGNQATLPAASDYVWSFTTNAGAAGTAPAGNISVLSTNPLAASSVCSSGAINATFDVPSGLRMDPATVNSTTFTLTGPALTPVVASSISLDANTGKIVTFTPASALTAGATYTATLKSGASGVKDLAVPENTLLNDFSWSFTVAAGNCQAPIALGSASTFGNFGGSAGTTNQGLLSVINGDIGTTAVSTAVTGFHDAGPGCTYTETPLNNGVVNGLIYTAAPPPTVSCPTEGTATTFAIASQARADALIAYNAMVARPAGPDAGSGNLANLTLKPGVYTAGAGTFMITGGDLTLDAQGDANAVWVFQMAKSLTVGGASLAQSQSVILTGGAQAKNVFWQVGSAATINPAGGGTMVGTIISRAGAAFSTSGSVTVLTLNGRVLSLDASVTLVNTVINVPAP